jgi:hypothetical protein
MAGYGFVVTHTVISPEIQTEVRSRLRKAESEHNAIPANKY